MIHKTFNCEIPPFTGGDARFERDTYKVHAWGAPGSDLVNVRIQDRNGFSDVESHSKRRYKLKTIDEMVDYLFYVVK